MQRLTVWAGVAVMLGVVMVVTIADTSGRPTPPIYEVTGAVTPIASPQQFVRTASLNNAGLPTSNPAYYVVKGVPQHGRWHYPFSVSVAGETVAAIPLALNQKRHTELVEVGIPTPTLLQWANPTLGGTSRQSTVTKNPGH